MRAAGRQTCACRASGERYQVQEDLSDVGAVEVVLEDRVDHALCAALGAHTRCHRAGEKDGRVYASASTAKHNRLERRVVRREEEGHLWGMS